MGWKLDHLFCVDVLIINTWWNCLKNLICGQNLKSYFPGYYCLDLFFFNLETNCGSFFCQCYSSIFAWTFYKLSPKGRYLCSCFVWDLQAVILLTEWLIVCSLQVCLSLPQSMKPFLSVVTFKYSTWQVCFTLWWTLYVQPSVEGAYLRFRSATMKLLLQWIVIKWHNSSRSEVPQNTLLLRTVMWMRETDKINSINKINTNNTNLSSTSEMNVLTSGNGLYLRIFIYLVILRRSSWTSLSCIRLVWIYLLGVSSL